jgi:hypothetical protein
MRVSLVHGLANPMVVTATETGFTKKRKRKSRKKKKKEGTKITKSHRRVTSKKLDAMELVQLLFIYIITPVMKHYLIFIRPLSIFNSSNEYSTFSIHMVTGTERTSAT